MRLTAFSLLFAFYLFFQLRANAQSANPMFRNLTYVTYEVSGSEKNTKIDITDYIEIKGNIVHRMVRYYKGVSDTTYMLPDSVVNKLNLVFNGKQKMQSFMKTDKLPAGMHYGGDPSFITYADIKNTQDNFIVVPPLMDKTFQQVLEIFYSLPASYSNVKYKGAGVKNAALQQLILKYHSSCSYIGSVQSPPPAMN